MMALSGISAPASALHSHCHGLSSCSGIGRLPGPIHQTAHVFSGKGSSSTPALPSISMASENTTTEASKSSRREANFGILLGTLFAAAQSSIVADDAVAVSSSRRALRYELVPESEYKTIQNGLKFYDIKVGGGPAAVRGSRVAVHYVAKWKGITFMTSRQGMGVTGGTPYGFDVGASDVGLVLKGLDLGVEGMRVGGQRNLIVPPEYAYGDKGVQEIPPGATLQINVELLSIKQTPFGSGVKLVEG